MGCAQPSSAADGRISIVLGAPRSLADVRALARPAAYRRTFAVAGLAWAGCICYPVRGIIRHICTAASATTRLAGAAGAGTQREGRLTMATQQEREAFMRGWRAAMDEVLGVLSHEVQEWAQEEADASASGEYKLPGSFALDEVRGSFRGRHELLVWITQNGPAAARGNDPALKEALDALIEDRATDADRAALGLAPVHASGGPQE